MSMHEDRAQERQTVAVLVEEGEGLLERDCLLARQPFYATPNSRCSTGRM
jgi:hypothetical protein